MVQEDGFLHPGDDAVGVDRAGAGLAHPAQQFIPELGGEVLGLAAGQEERGVLGAAVAPPKAVIAADLAVVVLELDEVEGAAAEQECIHLMPAAVGVAELEVGPHAVGGDVRDLLEQVVQTRALVGELGGGDLDPALDCHHPSCLACLARHARSCLLPGARLSGSSRVGA